MAFYWFDSNVFMQAKNGPYAFDIAPSFWTWILNMCAAGKVRTSSKVFGEIAKGNDQLARWCKHNRSCGLFVSPDASTQKYMTQVSTVVHSNYEGPFAAKFLSGADPWVIAHALNDQGTVVTHEVFSNGREVKIPNVCITFSVACVPVYDAFRQLGLKL